MVRYQRTLPKNLAPDWLILAGQGKNIVETGAIISAN